jgi:hypothetical protein
MKPGYNTTEFWSNLLIQTIGMLVIFDVVPSADQGKANELALGAMTVSQSIYTLVRGWVKRGTAAK